MEPLTFPASRPDMIPLLATKQSARVVLPATADGSDDFANIQLTAYAFLKNVTDIGNCDVMYI